MGRKRDHGFVEKNGFERNPMVKYGVEIELDVGLKKDQEIPFLIDDDDDDIVAFLKSYCFGLYYFVDLVDDDLVVVVGVDDGFEGVHYY